MGFVVCYNYSGSVDTILPFRGYRTRIDSLDPSPDNTTISVSGTYDGFIESGPWVWNSWEGANSFSGNGVTGSPYGATNINYPGLNVRNPRTGKLTSLGDLRGAEDAAGTRAARAGPGLCRISRR